MFLYALYKCNFLWLDHSHCTKSCASKISTKPHLNSSQENWERDKLHPESRTVKYSHDQTVFKNLLFRK